MGRIEIGSLVCMGKRKIKGQGIVLDRVKDINEYAGFDLSDAFYRSFDRSHPDYHWDRKERWVIYSLRSDLHTSINDEIVRKNPEVDIRLLEHFWHYNSAFSVLKYGDKILKPKIDFSLVLWTKAPSNYGSNPADWYKGKARWQHTKALKNL